jgi:hypothetical protein
MLEGENGPGGFAENFDGWAQHACMRTYGWAQLVGILGKRATDGPKMWDRVGLHARG